MPSVTDLCYLSAHELTSAIAAKRISPVELLEAVFARLDAVESTINAFVAVDREVALAASRRAEGAVLRGEPLGPLHGLPLSVKDLLPVIGLPTRYGSLLSSAQPSREDSVAAGRARQAGAILFGKTTTPEYGCKSLTDSKVSGTTRNPWQPEHSSGGSSGGAGAAVAAGVGPLALGSDGGGSIRIPASCCGVFGLKPTLGRVPLYPVPNSFAFISVVGPLTRTVRDAAMLLDVIAGLDNRDPFARGGPVEDWSQRLEDGARGLRVAWSQDLGQCPVEPEVRRLTSKAAGAFDDLGARLEEADPGFEVPYGTFMTLFAAQFAARVADHLATRQADIDPYLVHLAERGLKYSALELVRAQEAATALRRQVMGFFEQYDLLLTPVLAHPPLRADHRMLEGITVAGTHFAETRQGYNPFTFPFNLTGNPAASVPCGFTTDGLPVGLQIVGPHGGEGLVLRAAAAFEAARPWAAARPSL